MNQNWCRKTSNREDDEDDQYCTWRETEKN